MTGPHEILTRRRALAGLGVLAGLTGAGCASSKAGTPPVPGFTARACGSAAPVARYSTSLPAPGVVYVSDAFPPGTIYAIWA